MADDIDKQLDAAVEEGRKGYEVGFRKPPISTRFQTGESGNPDGPPRKRKGNHRLQLRKALKQKVRVTTQGVELEVTVLRAADIRLVHDAASGNIKALSYIHESLDNEPPSQRFAFGYINQYLDENGKTKYFYDPATGEKIPDPRVIKRRRPARKLQLADEEVEQFNRMLREELEQTVTVKIGGRSKKVSMLDLAHSALNKKLVQGDAHAVAFTKKFAEREKTRKPEEPPWIMVYGANIDKL